MKIYTRTGDDGTTGLFGGQRVPKDDPRIAAVGTVDELNAALGLVRMEAFRASSKPAEIDALVDRLQHRLFDLGAELATPRSASAANLVSEANVAELEQAIDRYDAELPPLREFILPGGCPLTSQLHMARAICRRAERLTVTLAAADEVRPEIVHYLNRLSDLLFVLARAANAAAGVPDVPWQKEK
jgi:cob(I)alamin adenosyltransferase